MDVSADTVRCRGSSIVHRCCKDGSISVTYYMDPATKSANDSVRFFNTETSLPGVLACTIANNCSRGGEDGIVSKLRPVASRCLSCSALVRGVSIIVS